MSEQWMSIVEYARAYSISDMTVRRRIKTGRLHAELRDGKYFIPIRDEVETTAPLPTRSPQVRFSDHAPENCNNTNAPDLFHVKARPSVGLTSREIITPSRESRETLEFQRSIERKSSEDEQRLAKAIEQAVRCLREAEQRMEQSYTRQIDHLQSEVTVRDLKINQLSQRVEDLETLIKMLEKSR